MSDILDCKKTSAARRDRGFTLIELIVTIAIVAILLTIALPSFRDLIISNNVTGTTNQLLSELNVARSEAVRRGSMVAVISNSGTNNWSSGWHVETDGDFKGDGTFAAIPIASGNDVLLRTNPGVNSAGAFQYNVTTSVAVVACPTAKSTPSPGMVIFNSQGFQPCNVSAFDINICRPDSNAARSKRITIAASGIVTTQVNTTGSPAPGC